MSNDRIRIPDLEVSVMVGGSEQYRMSAYLDRDIHQGFHVVAAIEQPTSSQAIRSLLLAAIAQIDHAVWKPLDVLGSDSVSERGERPF